MKSLTLKTSDGMSIAAHLYDKPLGNPKGFIVYTHMMPATKESWQDLAEAFEERGYVGIAIDLRGHGESEDGPEGYKSYDIEGHRNGKLDINTAVEHLISLGASIENIHLIGASIGGSLSLERFAENTDHPKAVLLSAGLNYANIDAVSLVKNLQPNQSILQVTSTDDRVEGNTEENKKIFDSIPENVSKKLIIYERANHGTAMFKTDEEPNLKKSILEFIENA